MNMNKSKMALLTFQRVINEYKGFPQAETAKKMLNKINEYLNQKEMKETVQKLKKTIEKLNKNIEELKTLTQSKEILEGSPAEQKNVKAFEIYKKAKAYYDSKNYNEAIKLFKQVSEKFPSSPLAPRAQLMMGKIYSDIFNPNKDYGKAIITTAS